MRPDRHSDATEYDEAALVEGTRARAQLIDLAEGDPSARRQALLIDPSLTAVGGEDLEFGADDIASVKHAVRVARRLQSLQTREQGSRSQPWSGLAAALLLFAVFLGPADVDRSGGQADLQSAWPMQNEAAITHPGVEAINLPAARVYELAEEDFEVVLIVDESFEL